MIITVKDMVKRRTELAKKRVDAEKAYTNALRAQLADAENAAAHDPKVKELWDAYLGLEKQFIALDALSFEVASF